LIDLKSKDAKNEKFKDFNQLMHMHPPPPHGHLLEGGVIVI
jgi:hypothetical protein